MAEQKKLKDDLEQMLKAWIGRAKLPCWVAVFVEGPESKYETDIKVGRIRLPGAVLTVATQSSSMETMEPHTQMQILGPECVEKRIKDILNWVQLHGWFEFPTKAKQAIYSGTSTYTITLPGFGQVVVDVSHDIVEIYTENEKLAVTAAEQRIQILELALLTVLSERAKAS